MTIPHETIARLRELLRQNEFPALRATDYTDRPVGGKGIAIDDWQVFLVKPGELLLNCQAEIIAETLTALPALLDAAERGLAIDCDDLSAIRNQRDSAIRDSASAIGELQQWRERAEKAERELERWNRADVALRELGVQVMHDATQPLGKDVVISFKSLEAARAAQREAEAGRQYWMREALSRDTDGDARDVEMRRPVKERDEALALLREVAEGPQQLHWPTDGSVRLHSEAVALLMLPPDSMRKLEGYAASAAPVHPLVWRLIRPERQRDLIGFSVVVSVDDSEEYIAAVRHKIIKSRQHQRITIKYHNAVVGDFSAVEFRADDRVCDTIVCTRTDFNHCEVSHITMLPNAKDQAAP